MKLQRICECPQYPMKLEPWIIEKFDELNCNAEPYLMVSVNIKNFKYINIQYGWEQGNEILHLIYLSMQRLLHEDEYIAYRSADNFVLLLRYPEWDMSEETAHVFIQTVLVTFVDAVFEIDDERVYKKIFASFGIYPVSLRYCSAALMHRDMRYR